MFLDRGENPTATERWHGHHRERQEPNKNLAGGAETTTGATPDW